MYTRKNATSFIDYSDSETSDVDAFINIDSPIIH